MTLNEPIVADCANKGMAVEHRAVSRCTGLLVPLRRTAQRPGAQRVGR